MRVCVCRVSQQHDGMDGGGGQHPGMNGGFGGPGGVGGMMGGGVNGGVPQQMMPYVRRPHSTDIHSTQVPDLCGMCSHAHTFDPSPSAAPPCSCPAHVLPRGRLFVSLLRAVLPQLA